MKSIDVTQLTIQELVQLLKSAGSASITEEAIYSNLEQGLPTNSNNTINLITYTAWLIKENSSD